MAPLPNAATRAIVRGALHAAGKKTSSTATAVASTSTAALSTTAHRGAGDPPIFKSPFHGTHKATEVPDFGEYKAGSEANNRLFSYFMVGTMGALTAAGMKSTVHGRFICCHCWTVVASGGLGVRKGVGQTHSKWERSL